MEPTTTQKLFDRIDCSAGDFQYVVVAGTTYLFWIQPGMGPNDLERVNWCNLETTQCGQDGAEGIFHLLRLPDRSARYLND